VIIDCQRSPWPQGSLAGPMDQDQAPLGIAPVLAGFPVLTGALVFIDTVSAWWLSLPTCFLPAVGISHLGLR
jgi:hypothetical protein